MLSRIINTLSCFLYLLIIYSCNNSNNSGEMIIYNENGLQGRLQEILTCFIEQYKIPEDDHIYISEGYLRTESKLLFPTMDINRHIYIVIKDYAYDIPIIGTNRVLYKTKLNNHIIFYALDKDKEMGISNNLVWEVVESPIKEELPIIVDYLETQFIYNIQENVIELSDFKSESCKGRLNDEYEW